MWRADPEGRPGTVHATEADAMRYADRVLAGARNCVVWECPEPPEDAVTAPVSDSAPAAVSLDVPTRERPADRVSATVRALLTRKAGR